MEPGEVGIGVHILPSLTLAGIIHRKVTHDVNKRGLKPRDSLRPRTPGYRMVKISTKVISSEEDELLVVDGIPLSSSSVHRSKRDGKLSVDIFSEEESEWVTRYSLDQLQPLFSQIGVTRASPFPELTLDINVAFPRAQTQEPITIWISYSINFEQWAEPWTIAAFNRIVRNVVKEAQGSGLTLSDNELSTETELEFEVSLHPSSASATQAIDYWVNVASSLIRDAKGLLSANSATSTAHHYV